MTDFDAQATDIGLNLVNNWGADVSPVVAAPIALNARSYYSQMNASGQTNGTYGVVIETNFGEGKLAALDAGGYVDMYLYHFGTDLENYFATFDEYYLNVLQPNSDGSNYAVLRLSADGSTILNPTSSSEVPLPGTMLLFGSSLLGLFGIRRKEA
jgi:hypothetical protein